MQIPVQFFHYSWRNAKIHINNANPNLYITMPCQSEPHYYTPGWARSGFRLWCDSRQLQSKRRRRNFVGNRNHSVPSVVPTKHKELMDSIAEPRWHHVHRCRSKQEKLQTQGIIRIKQCMYTTAAALILCVESTDGVTIYVADSLITFNARSSAQSRYLCAALYTR